MIYENMRKKIKVMQIVIVFCLCAIVGKLGYLQIIQYNKLQELASDLWERSFPLTANRGYIYDSNNKALAINLPVMSVAVIPFQLDDAEMTAKELARILNAKESVIYTKITKRVSVVKLSEGKKINDKQATELSKLKLAGVYLIQDSDRHYPYDDTLAHTLGFVGIDNQGLSGLEAYYDNFLTGADGSLNYVMNAKGGLLGNLNSRIESPVSGMSLQLTVDLNIQGYLERELENAWAKYNPASIIGIAMRPNTGEILAISNRPTFNPNSYQDFSPDIYNRNLSVWSSFEPGSTFKAMTFAAALEEEVIDMHKDTYYDKGYEIVDGRTIKSWKKGGHGLQTYLQVIENSSNPGFVDISRKLGQEKLYDYLEKFGVGIKTGVDIMGESAGIIFDKENFTALNAAVSSFGQGNSMTAIQLMTAFCSIINGGYLMQPYITKTISHTGTKDAIYVNEPSLQRQVISNDTSDLMREALESVVANGGGRLGYIDGYRVGGKTGTAQKVIDGIYSPNQYILSYIAAAPMNNPEIAVYIAMDSPRSTIQYGGTVIGPMIKSFLSDALPYLGVKKNYEHQLDLEYTWMDTKTYPVENYIGLDPRSIKSQYFKIEIIGTGDKVIDQLPRVGEKLEEGKTVVILT